jgi:hypothetical protein
MLGKGGKERKAEGKRGHVEIGITDVAARESFRGKHLKKMVYKAFFFLSFSFTLFFFFFNRSQ